MTGTFEIERNWRNEKISCSWSYSRLGISVTTQVVLDDNTLQALDGKLINLLSFEMCNRCVLFLRGAL